MNEPQWTPIDHDAPPRDELHQSRRQRGCTKKDSNSVFDTRLATMDALDRRGAHEIRDKLPDFYNKRDRGGGLPLAFAMDKEVEI